MLTSNQLKDFKQHLGNCQDDLMCAFNALGDKTRFKIFKALLQQRGLCVTEIALLAGVSVPAASQQLRLMEDAGLVERERDGQKMCYQVNREKGMIRSLARLVLNQSS